MANLRAARRNLYAIGAILIVVDIAAIFVLLSPNGNVNLAKQDEFNQLRLQVQSKARTVVPPDQVQQRVEEARKQIAQFAQERLPGQPSELSVELGKLAADSGVHLGSVRYQEVDSDVPAVRRFQLTATISGDYLQEVKFINALERSRHFYVINSVTLGEQQPGAVRLGVNVDAYLKETS
jgi:type IV pilus assembly protein PilO